MKTRHVIILVSVLTLGKPTSEQAYDSANKYCDISFRIFNSCNSNEFEDFCVEDGLGLFYSRYYNPYNCNTVILGLPFLGKTSTSSITGIIDALAARCEFNIILLDNSFTTDVSVWEYGSTIFNAYNDALRFANVLDRAVELGLLSPRCITAIGYSMGAQLVGHVCRNIQYKCNQIYGLDPAGPFYFPQNTITTNLLPALQTVSQDDACKVTFLMCNSGALGTVFRSADEHIIVNSGIVQPVCSGLNPIMCSHDLCNLLMMDAITNPGACLARRKNCLEHPHSCRREGIRNISLPADDKCYRKDHNVAEVFYMTTSSHGRCKGLQGAHPPKSLMDRIGEGLEAISGWIGSWFQPKRSNVDRRYLNS